MLDAMFETLATPPSAVRVSLVVVRRGAAAAAIAAVTTAGTFAVARLVEIAEPYVTAGKTADVLLARLETMGVSLVKFATCVHGVMVALGLS